MTIGERLEEARKRRGVSIREAAEATKIRGDYLTALEDGSFNIPLPEIYIRGFLRNYGRYLRLDAEKLLTDYEARRRGKTMPPMAVPSGSTAAAGRESMGRMEIGDETAAPVRKPIEGKAPMPAGTDAPGGAGDPRFPIDPNLLIRGGIAIGAGLLILVIVLVMINVLRQDPPPLNQELATPATQEAIPETGRLRFTARDRVGVLVIQISDNARLYSAVIPAGTTTDIVEHEGPVEVRFDKGEALIVEHNGQQLSPLPAGRGRTILR